MTKCELCELCGLRVGDDEIFCSWDNMADLCGGHFGQYRKEMRQERCTKTTREWVDAKLAVRGSKGGDANAGERRDAETHREVAAGRTVHPETGPATPGDVVSEARAEHRTIVESALTPCSECQTPLRKDQMTILGSGVVMCGYCVLRWHDAHQVGKPLQAPLDVRIDEVRQQPPESARHPSDWDVFSTPTWES